MTTLLTLHKGLDPRYLTEGAGPASHVGGTRYYTETAGEPPGRWAGQGAAALGLAGEVDPEVMQRLYLDDEGPAGPLAARRKAAYRPVKEREDLAVAAHLSLHPLATEGELAEVRRAERARSYHATPYFDWTASLVKSVSVLHASYLVDARRARERGADDAAEALEVKAAELIGALASTAEATVARIEETAAYTRTGYHSGSTGEYRDAAGVTAAYFIQHTSREGDPQLHVHIAILNRVQRADGADGKYRTLDSKAMYRERLAVAAFTNRTMATRLTDLGYVLVPRPDGNGFEIGGVDAEVMEAFSSRRAQVTPELERLVAEYRRVHGCEPSRRVRWQLAQHATLKTRKTKAERKARPGAPQTVAGELAAWEARTSEREITELSRVHRAVAEWAAARTGEGPADLDAVQRARVIRIAVAEVSRQNAAWTKAQLAWEMHRAMPALPRGADQAKVLDELVDEALSGGADVVRLGPGPDVVDVAELGIRASDGQSVYRPPGQDRWAAAETLDIEEWLLGEARRQVPQAITVEQAAAALEGTGLYETQREVAAGLLTSTRAINVLVAPAGTGKTHTVAAFAQAWTAWTGRRVIGLATSTNAARVMAGEGLAEAYNTARFLGRLEDGSSKGAVRISRDDVLVIDEASQISTADLAAIQTVAKAAGARVILTGDTVQLGAVEAGGMMRLIAHDMGHWALHEVRRFDAEWERRASLDLRNGDTKVWAAYDARGRLRAGPHGQAEADAVGLWLADWLMGRDTLLLAGSNEEAAELAAMARKRLADFGKVPVRPEVTLADGNGAAVGDHIRARQNVHLDAGGKELANRDTLRITGWTIAMSGRAALAERQDPDLPGGWSRTFPVPVDYLTQHAELAYAGNVHVAQGRTVTTGHLLVSPTLSREGLYVGMSRGRESNTAYVATGPAQVRGQDPAPQAEPEAVLEAIMASEDAPLTATETMRQAQDYATSTRHLFPMWQATTRRQAYTGIDARLKARLSARDYARYEREPQRPVLQRQLRAAELAGVDLDMVLDAATARDMNGARSVSAALHGRIKHLNLPQPGRTVTWAERTPAAGRDGVAGQLATVMDARREELGRQLYAEPEPWILAHLGSPPPQGSSPALVADWQMRAGIAASYRELAGITDPDVALGPAPQGHPELTETYAATLRALEIPDVQAQARAMTRGELEADVAAYDRVRATAPPEPSQQLRAASMAEVDARAAAARLEAEGQVKAATARQRQAGAASVRATELEGRMQARQAWEEATAGHRARAERAMAELANRGQETQAEAERQAEAAPGPETPDEPAEPTSLPGQFRQDMANVAALEAKLDREAQVRQRQPEAVAAAEEPDPPDPERQVLMDRTDAALAAMADAQAEAAQREASREAYTLRERQAEAETSGPSAWVSGQHTPSRDSSAADIEQPGPVAEVGGPEAEL